MEEKLIVRGAREHNLAEHRRGAPPGPAGGDHRAVRVGQVLPGLRHHLCRGPATLRRVPVRLRPAVPGRDGEAGRGRHRGPLARDLHRAEDHGAEPPLHGGHGHGDLRLPAPPLGPGGHAPLRRVRATGASASRRRRSWTGCCAWPEGTRIEVLAPLVRGRKGEFRELFEDARKKGFVRVRVDGETHRPGAAAQAEPAPEPRHSLGRGPPGGAGGGPGPPGGLRRDGAADGRGRRRGGGARRGRSAETHLFSERYACVHCGTSLAELEPRQFSFNSPYGACEACGGLGTRREVNPELVVGDPIISLLEGVMLPWGEPRGHLRRSIIPGLARPLRLRPQHALGRAAGGRPPRRPARPGETRRSPSATRRAARRAATAEPWEGVLANVRRRYEETSSDCRARAAP